MQQRPATWCWQRLLAVYVAEVQDARTPGRQQQQQQQRSGPGGRSPHHRHHHQQDHTEQQAEEVALEAAAARGDAGAARACQRRVLRHVFGVFLEEVGQG